MDKKFDIISLACKVYSYITHTGLNLSISDICKIAVKAAVDNRKENLTKKEHIDVIFGALFEFYDKTSIEYQRLAFEKEYLDLIESDKIDEALKLLRSSNFKLVGIKDIWNEMNNIKISTF